jgi:hypothetical protein
MRCFDLRGANSLISRDNSAKLSISLLWSVDRFPDRTMLSEIWVIRRTGWCKLFHDVRSRGEMRLESPLIIVS